MTPEQLADHYYKLAERAWDRQKSRRGVELQTGLALWTVFGAGAAASITARDWSPPVWIAVCFTLVAAVILYIYRYTWLPWISKTTHRDLATNYFWETRLQQQLGDHLLPNYLRPEVEHDFPTIYDQNGANVGGAAYPNRPRVLPSNLSANHKMQLAVTFMFMLLFVLSVWSRVDFGFDAKDGVHLTVGGTKVDVQGKSKISVVGKEIHVDPSE